MLRFLVTAEFPTSLFLVILMMEATYPSETSVLTGVTQHNITEDGILHNHRRKNLKSYIAFTGWALYQEVMYIL
jgi:hypothetical protein